MKKIHNVYMKKLHNVYRFDDLDGGIEVTNNRIELKRFGSTTTRCYQFVGHRFYSSEIGGPIKMMCGQTFSGCMFSNMYICGVSFRGCSFINCSFSNITLVGCNFENCEFINCRTDFATNIENVRFCVTKVYYCNMCLNNVAFVEFTHAHIGYSTIAIYGPVVAEIIIGDDTSIDDSDFRICTFTKENNKIRPAIFIKKDSEISKETMSYFLYYQAHLGYDIEFEVLPYIPMICPEQGEFIGYKRAFGIAKDINHERVDIIIKLLIPKDALRSSSIDRKCRCSKAVVMGFYDPDTQEEISDVIDHGVSLSDPSFEYKLNSVVYPHSFNTNRWLICASGLHFFMNFKEAVEY